MKILKVVILPSGDGQTAPDLIASQIEIKDISFDYITTDLNEGQTADIGGSGVSTGQTYYAGATYRLNLNYKYLSDSGSCLTLRRQDGTIVVPESLGIICNKGEDVEKQINIGVQPNGNYYIAGYGFYTGDQIQPALLQAGREFRLCNLEECSNPVVLRAA